jgi:O-antigen ligase
VAKLWQAFGLGAAGIAVLQLAGVSALAALDPVGIMVAAVALAAFALLSATSPCGGLAAVVLTLPYFFRPLTIDHREFAASEVLLLTTAAGCAMRIAFDSAHARGEAWIVFTTRLRRLFAERYLVLLIAGCIAGAFLVMRPFDVAARDAALREWRWTLIEPLLFVVLLTVFATNRHSRLLIVAALVLSSVAIALQGLYDLAEGGGIAAESVRRLAAPFPHPNAFALYSLRVTVFTLALWAFVPSWRRVLLLPAALSTIALLASFSRGALVALCLALLVIGWRFGWRRQITIILGASGLVGMLVLLAGGRMLNAFEGGSITLRGDIWAAALRMVRDRPISGFGPDMFYYAYNPRYIEPTGWPERFTSHAHNLLLDAWIRLGIIGAGLAASALWGVGRATLQVAAARFGRDSVAAAAMVSLGALLLHGMVDNAYFGHDLAMSAWLLAWLAVGASAADPAEGTS